MKLENLFKRAYSRLNKADCALQEIYKALLFIGFQENDLPNISSSGSGSEIFLEWRGSELHEEQILYIMETDGVISPDSFSTHTEYE